MNKKNLTGVFLWGWVISTFLLAGCFTRQTVLPVQIKLEDNVNGASRPAWVFLPDQRRVRIDVDQKVGDCVLREFVIIPKSNPQTGQRMEQVVPPDAFEAGKAVFYIPVPPGEITILSRFVHTVLVEEGNQSKFPEGTESMATGQLRAGRMLSGGFSFDHYDFSTKTTGPGGASAWVKEASFPGSPEAFLQIGWHFDRFSKVDFKWGIYATGPCGVTP